ncbi:hypothetical protein ACUHGC_07620 [Testudinibacter sp. P27/CKL/0425]
MRNPTKPESKFIVYGSIDDFWAQTMMLEQALASLEALSQADFNVLPNQTIKDAIGAIKWQVQGILTVQSELLAEEVAND